MPKIPDPSVIPPRLSLRNAIFRDCKELSQELPIRGGWGYSKEDAILIDKNDPLISREVAFDAVGLQYLVAEKRTYEELVVHQLPGEDFANIMVKLKEQSRIREGDKIYDWMKFTVYAMKRTDAGKGFVPLGGFYFYHPECWFDISSLF